MDPRSQEPRRNPQEMVTAPLACIRCGGPLQWVALAAPCPRCGTPVQLTLDEPPLSEEHPAALENLRLGARWVVWTFIASVAVGLIMVIWSIAVAIAKGDAKSIGQSPLLNFSATVLSLAVSISQVMGYWRLTTPGIVPSALDRANSAGASVRTLALATLFVGLCAVPLQLLGVVSNDHPLVTVGQIGLSLVSWVLHAVLLWKVMVFARPFVARIPDARLTNQTRIYAWLLPLLATVGIVVCLGPFVAYVLYAIFLWQFQGTIGRVLVHVQWAPANHFA